MKHIHLENNFTQNENDAMNTKNSLHEISNQKITRNNFYVRLFLSHSNSSVKIIYKYGIVITMYRITHSLSHSTVNQSESIFCNARYRSQLMARNSISITNTS